ncbi:MAG: hypothetical protein WCX81_01845 [Monoglobales bacterium]
MDFLKAYELCRKKFDVHMEKFHQTVPELGGQKDGNYYVEGKTYTPLVDKWVWLGSFVTGLAPLFYKNEKDANLLKWANKFKYEYHKKMFGDGMKYMHDLGFLYMPYSVELYRLTGDPMHKDDAIKAADELCKRFDIKGGYIEAWSDLDGSEMNHRWMIADSTMNISLLFWAWQETGKFYYKDIAEAHIENVEKHLIRSDWSVAHAFKFYEDGSPKYEQNSCGYKEGSHWARGTGWVVYGLTIAAAYTGNKHYLELAKNVLKKWIEENKNADLIPIWDFRLPENEPARACSAEKADWDGTDPANLDKNIDTSAAAIISCAILLMNDISPEPELTEYADKMLQSLCDKYLNKDESIPGLLSHSNGNMQYTVYGDWYFIEALAKKVHGTPNCWYQPKN